MEYAKIIAKEADSLPLEKQAEVLDFIEFLKVKQSRANDASAPRTPAEIEAMFAVAAETLPKARAAAALAVIDYEDLPPLLGALHPTFNISRLKLYRDGSKQFPGRPQRLHRESRPRR